MAVLPGPVYLSAQAEDDTICLRSTLGGGGWECWRLGDLSGPVTRKAKGSIPPHSKPTDKPRTWAEESDLNEQNKI